MTEPMGGSLPPEGSRLPSLPVRAVQVFLSPIRLFEGLRVEPAGWGALLMAGVIAGAANALIPAELWEDMMRRQMSQAGAEVPMDLGTMATFGRIAGSVGALISMPIMGMVAAGIFSLIFLFGFGYEGRFRQYFAVTAHALLLLAISGAALTPLRILTENVQFTITLGGLLPFLGDSLPGRFLNLADLFSLWAVALIGVGAATIDGKKSLGSSAALAIGAVLLILLLVASFGVGARGV